MLCARLYATNNMPFVMQLGDFYLFMKQYGVDQFVDKVERIFVDVAGWPGYTSLLLACSYNVPSKAWVSP
jgi:hypothetical protein